MLEHWILVVDDASAETVYRGDLALTPPHFLGSAAFVPAKDELVLFGSEDCDAPITPNLSAHEIALVR